VYDAMKIVHNGLNGHMGVNLSVIRVKEQGVDASDSRIRKFVTQYIKECAHCQKWSRWRLKTLRKHNTTVVQGPGEVCQIDFIGPLIPSAGGKKYIFLVVDSFSRWTELYACENITAQEAVSGMLQWVSRFGVPKRCIRSDNASTFTGKMFSNLMKVLNTELRCTISYRPQANGIAESKVGSTKRFLKALVRELGSKDVRNWCRYLPLAQRIINAAPCYRTGIAPAQILYAGQVDLQAEFLHPRDGARLRRTPGSTYIEDCVERYEELVAAAQKYQEQEVQKYLDKGPVESTQFAAGELVLIKSPKGPKHSLIPPYIGPVRVLSRSNDMYTVKGDVTGIENTYDVSVMKRYYPDPNLTDQEVASWDASAEWIVENILMHRRREHTTGKRKKDFEFLLLWQIDGSTTWERYTPDLGRNEALIRYLDEHSGDETLIPWFTA